MKKWTLPVLGIAMLTIVLSVASAGCLRREIVFEAEPFEPVESNELPKRVEKKFKKTYPGATIHKVESHVWPPSGKEHFRIAFSFDGEILETQFREGGDEIAGWLRRVPPESDSDAMSDRSPVDNESTKVIDNNK